MMRHATLIGSIISLLGPAPSVAAQSAPVSPARIDGVFASVTSRQSPGCAVATVRDGTIEFARGYGMADITRGAPITTKTPMNIGSVTKQFTAAAINLLVAEGRLSLDDDVRKYVPELPRYDATMTVRQLMNHTSGIRDHGELAALEGLSDDLTNAEALAILTRQRRTNFTPGTQWAYSNGGYVLLSILVERVSGQPLPAFAEKRFFRPLGMTSTIFRVKSDQPKGRAQGYVQENGTWTTTDPRYGAVGHGGLYSTIEDMARWQRHMDRPQLLGAKWAELTDARGALTDGTSILYGAGLLHGDVAGHPTVEHSGGNPGNTAFVQRLPALHLSIVVLCNLSGEAPNRNTASVMGRRVAALYVGPPARITTEAVAPAVTLTAQQQAAYVGTYYSDQVPSYSPISVENGKLTWAHNRELVPLGGSRFQLAGTTTKITFLGTDTVVFDPRPFQPVYAPYVLRTISVRVGTAKRDLRDYAGTYVSSELLSRWTAQVKDTALVLGSPKGPTYRLYRAFEDGFESRLDGMLVRFMRDEKGEVTAMEVNAGGRAWHIRFERER